MSHGKSFSRFHRFLAKQRRKALRAFRDFEMPKDIIARKFKKQKEELQGT